MQSVPQLTAKDVDRVLRRDFKEDDFDKVVAILGDYGPDPWHREPVRVRVAALQLSQGDVSRLRSCLALAKRDYRDLLVAAEYPGYRKLGSDIRKLPAEQQEQVHESDRRQYDEWLTRFATLDKQTS